MTELFNEGSIHAKTRCWAQGMDGWRPLYTIPQLKWHLVATSQSALNDTDLSILILNMLIRYVCFFTLYIGLWVSFKSFLYSAIRR